MNRVVKDQKKIIDELSETNLALKKRNLELEKSADLNRLKVDYAQEEVKLSQQYKQELERLISSIDSQLKMQVNDPDVVVLPHTAKSDGAVIRMEERVLFRPGSATLSDSGKKILQKVIAVLQQYPDATFRIDGHTDSDPIKVSKHSSNWELGSKRALNVVEYFDKLGSIPMDRFFIASFSKYRPVDPNNKASNRRVEITVFPASN